MKNSANKRHRYNRNIGNIFLRKEKIEKQAFSVKKLVPEIQLSKTGDRVWTFR